jgi:hypothetical protein
VIVVFDSGIWVSAMEFGGTPLEAVIRAIAQDRFALRVRDRGALARGVPLAFAQRLIGRNLIDSTRPV